MRRTPPAPGIIITISLHTPFLSDITGNFRLIFNTAIESVHSCYSRYNLQFRRHPHLDTSLFFYSNILSMRYLVLLPSLVVVVLLSGIGAVAQHCHRTLGNGIQIEDCEIAVHKLLNPYTQHLSEAEISQDLTIDRNSTGNPHTRPEREGHGTCYVSVAMIRGYRPAVTISWRWLGQQLDHLLKTCVAERHLGGTSNVNGFGFMVAQIYY